ncbi:MAG: arylsulfatase [Verrucomicrobia bacterium]|nr:arylsulfatase [Verrucomicrobiota bacterium]
MPLFRTSLQTACLLIHPVRQSSAFLSMGRVMTTGLPGSTHRPPKRFSLGTLLVALALLAACVAQAQAPRAQRERFRKSPQPNIILIVADDLGYGDLGCYGQTRIKTPNLDRLAAEGMRFTQFYAGAADSTPSRAALMTGLHTGHGRIRGNKPIALAQEDTTLAEVLRAVGYKTCALGKWGLGSAGSTGMPTKQGFIDWFGYLDDVHSQNYYPTSLWRNERTFTLRGNLYGKRTEYSHDWFTKASLNYIRQQEIESFFLYIAYTLPQANQERQKAVRDGLEVPNDHPYTKEPWPQAEKNKAAMITRLDQDVGRILNAVRTTRLDEHTLILFTSDNGPHEDGGNKTAFFRSAGPLRGIKRDLYEGGIRVPMIARWTGKIPEGIVSDQVWAMWDLLPTLADIAGAKPPEKLDGLSMVPALLGKEQSEQHEFLYWESHEPGFQQAIRFKEWKGMRTAPGKDLELYHLVRDPGETNNVAASQQEITMKLSDLLKSARRESPDWPLTSTSPSPK